MPVRIKNRALVFQKQDELDKEWDDLRQILVSLVLAGSGKLTKLVVSDAGKKKKKLIIRLPSPFKPELSAWCESDVMMIRSILTQAEVVGIENLGRWDTVSACLPDMSIHAAISLIPGPTRKAQFISLGSNPVFVRNNANELYSEVNRLFASSDFGTIERGCAASSDFGLPIHQYAGGSSTSWRYSSKGINKWPMFYIRINTRIMPQRIDDDGYDPFPETDKSVQRIMEVLSAMITEFLKQHNLRPRSTKRKRQQVNETLHSAGSGEEPRRSRSSSTRQAGFISRREPELVPSSSTEEALDGQLKLPSLKRSPLVSADSGVWSKIKSSKELSFDNILQTKRSGLGPPRPDQTQYTPPPPPPTEPAEAAEDDVSNDSIISSIDPYTKQRILINSRTGCTMNPQCWSGGGEGRPLTTGSLRNGRRLSVSRRPTSANSAGQNMWVESLLRKWENPVFQRSERPISSAGRPESRDSLIGGGCNNHYCASTVFGMGASHFAIAESRLSRKGLQTAHVIGQVDRKFILASVGSEGREWNDHGPSLVLVDQHAADERCRVEQLYETLFMTDDSRSVQTTQIGSIRFEIGCSETKPFTKYRDLFESWGISYTVGCVGGAGRGQSTLIDVQTLPTLIAERCRTDPSLLIDLLRQQVWKWDDNGIGSLPREREVADGHDGGGWVEKTKGCPQGIMDLINSRACRSAIMFNDELNVAECQGLVSRLASCRFPFQCAHGRPSMVPLLEFRGHDDVGRDTPEDFMKAFKKQYQ